jgi:hypothetical protein
MNFKKDSIVIDNNLYDLYIGKNAIGNDEIIKICHQDSLWFHINDVGNKEIFKCDHCNITLLRDVSAAKNILMKGLLSLPPGFIGG